MARLNRRIFAYMVGVFFVGVAGTLVVLEWNLHSNSNSTSKDTHTAPRVPKVVITASAPTPLASYRREKIYNTVKQLLANPPDQPLDASGFVQYVYEQAGITLPRTVQEQSTTGSPITNPAQLQEGDLVFFSSTPGVSQVTFDGIYIGNGQVAGLTTHGLRAFAISNTYWRPLFQFGVTVSN
ncbi:C40 family peptidase [Alicyclobacillus sp. ALC3]|uniref:C40 family peptidase n=1 Tax=Alicyclobacillus sp. ALC3 TaxID=2796143 RepID=UPI002378A0A2|nr:NlpC/P60 family protein [Alicyclobacillus sp. ALC3]WDL95731.1 C40 family peptidase [Alicyclobacillus sp. ALC3]